MVAGRDLRAAREACHVGIATLAKLMGKDKGHLSRVERGEREVTPSIISAYERALGVPINDSTFAATTGDTDDVHRREMLSLIATASVGAASAEPLARLLDGIEAPVPNRVGVNDVRAVEQATAACTTLDLDGAAETSAMLAAGALTWSTRLLSQSMSDTVRQRLSSAVGGLADRLGWSTYDQGDHRRALRTLTAGLDYASHGADRDLRAHAMLDIATVLEDMGRPAEGVEALRLALGDERISSAERANLHAVCARLCAAADQRTAGLRHIERAESALAEDAPAIVPDWVRQVTLAPGHLDAALGMALFALGEHDRAQSRLSVAVSTLGPRRARTDIRCRTRLAILRFDSGDKTGAELEARKVIIDARQVRSKRTKSDVAMLVSSARQYAPSLADELTSLASA